MPLTIEQLTKGIRYWRTVKVKGKSQWPSDFHNDYYKDALAEVRIKDGAFDLEWWNRFYPILHSWKATRPAKRSLLTWRAQERFEQLGKAWSDVIAPNLEDDIETVEWDQVSAFPSVVTEIKPLKNPSPVFTSKFCHLLAPCIFPIVDKDAVADKSPSYEMYFTKVREEWLSTNAATRTDLTKALTEAIGAPVFAGFPMKCKLVELCLIGRRQAS
jgi:hypothetical protein